MSRAAWNHNIHYHDLVLGSVPRPCRRALDVGCGTGLLARRLAGRCDEVVAIDLDHDTISGARASNVSESRIRFIEGDVMTHSFFDESFDFIAAVAALHHLPLSAALARFQTLLNAGGTLAVIGLYRAHAIEDYFWAAAALPTSWILRWILGQTDVAAPLQAPAETLDEIRGACESLLPGAIVRRHLLFRYSITWRKP
jgi:2-polyprenyl-3-methyl-5-hydroxy-6-metoxy-1,4-benzoquinol methylase